MEDKDEMPWGVHKGKKMDNVPADYLLWLWDNDKCSGQVKEYIKDNLEVIKSQIKSNHG